DPLDGANQVGSFAGTNGDAQNPTDFGANDIADGSSGTVFMRLNIDSFAGSNFSFGLSDTTSGFDANFGDFRSQLVISSSGFRVRDGGGSVTFDQTLSEDTWYDLWIVADNATDTSQVYIQGGAFSSQTQLTTGSGATNSWAFRSSAGDLGTFLIRSGSTHSDTVLLDDIYVDSSAVNLANPIPEPSTTYALILGATFLLVITRLRSNRKKA
ncbi:MAG: PEP-CTERM sorting domain-containing protein, partial [Verrucomicrobiota bacterium]